MLPQSQTGTAEKWINRLDENLLPVLPASAERLTKLLRDPEVALHDIGTIIASDPVMTLHLVREVQRQYGARVEGSLTNVFHCVAMLGLDKILMLARTFRPLADTTGAAGQHYLRAIASSLHAAEQVRFWLQVRQPSSADNAYLAALLMGITDACLWQFAPKEMRALHILTEQEQIPAIEAEVAVLGCSRAELAHGLAGRWRFPELVLAAMDPGMLPSAPFLLRNSRGDEADNQRPMPNRDAHGHLTHSPALFAALARWLAVESARGWESATMSRCISIIAACLRLPRDEALSVVHNAALNLSRHWNIEEVAAPAANLIWPLRSRKRRRIKPRQLPAAVAKLLAGKAPTPNTTAATPARPAPKTQHQAPRPIGMRSENLPADLDRKSILSAPPPPPPAATPNRAPGFLSAEKKRAFEQFLQYLAQPDHYRTEFEALRALVEHVHDCTSLERVVVALHNPDLDQVDGYFALGCEDFPGLKRYKVKLQPVNLFTHLLKQPAGVWISPDRPSSSAGLIPGSFKQATHTDEFFLMSVFDHKGPRAVMYADGGLTNRAGLSEAQYRIFKAGCNACSKHLISKGKAARSRGNPG